MLGTSLLYANSGTTNLDGLYVITSLSDMFNDNDSELEIDIYNEDEAVEMKIGDSFNNWDNVQRVVDSYAKQHGFVARKCRKELDAVDKSIIRRYVYSCWKSGMNKSKKVDNINAHRDSVSTKTISNFFLGKNDQCEFFTHM